MGEGKGVEKAVSPDLTERARGSLDSGWQREFSKKGETRVPGLVGERKGNGRRDSGNERRK